MSGNSQVNMMSALIVKKGDAAPSGYIVSPSNAPGSGAEAEAPEANGLKKEKRTPLTAEFVSRGREFAMGPARPPKTRPAPNSATATPDTSGEDAGGYRERNVSERSSGTTEKRFRKHPSTPSSINPVALYSVVFLVGFISFAFALDVSGDFIDMILESRRQS